MQQPTIKYGVLAGVLTIVYLLLFYWVDKSLFVNPWVNWIALLIYIAAMYLAISGDKKVADGFIDLKTATTSAFKTFLIANAFFHLFSYIMYNFVDSTLLTLANEQIMTTAKWFFTDEQLQQMTKELQEHPYEVSPSTTLLGFAKGAIGGFVLSFILAATQRNK